MTPLVSVVVPTYNRPHLLHKALSSVIGQRQVPGQVEVVVVNDGGADVTSAINAARGRGLAVRIINLAANRGLSTARNIGIESSRGEYLAFLDDDDIFLPDHLALNLDALSHAGVEASYGACRISTQRVDPLHPVAPAGSVAYQFDADLLAVANFIPVHSAVIRRPPTEARFDPTLAALEDWDMWLQLTREHAYRFTSVPEPTVVYHRISSEAGMCGATVTDAAALAGFGRLTDRMWRRWPAPTPKAAHFRLYIAVMYWHALASLCEGTPIADLYFWQCVEHIAAVWTEQRDEADLTQQIINSIKDGADAPRTA
ncbi:glycosyltransferase family 2 protein [Micromonosporaceae bacterium Da 78-11]